MSRKTALSLSPFSLPNVLTVSMFFSEITNDFVIRLSFMPNIIYPFLLIVNTLYGIGYFYDKNDIKAVFGIVNFEWVNSSKRCCHALFWVFKAFGENLWSCGGRLAPP